MESPLVSVIVPCYNYGHYLPETLQSVAEQTHKNFECIVIDDGSTDNTKAVADNFVKGDSRFKYIHQTNQGLSTARNTGIKHAKGSFVQFLDADDLIHFQKLEVQIKHANNSLVFSDYKYFDKSASLDQAPVTNCTSKTITSTEALLYMTTSNLLMVNGALVPIEKLRAVGEFKPSYRALEDWNFWFRMAANGTPFVHLACDQPLALVRRHASSMSRNPARMLTAHSLLVSEMSEYFNSLGRGGESLQNALKANKRKYRGSIIFDEIQYGSLSGGLLLAIGSAVQSPGDFFWYLRNSLYSIKVRLRGK